jgi:hypothetical protein
MLNRVGDTSRASKEGNVMRQQVLTSSLLIALTAQVDAQPILDDPTPCSVVVRAFASKDEAQMHEVSKLMDDVFEKLDREYTKDGEHGILSERIGPVLKAMGVGFCEQNQGSTISIEAAKAYRDMRILKVRTGIEP